MGRNKMPPKQQDFMGVYIPNLSGITGNQDAKNKLDARYLLLDASNDPITSNLEITGNLTLNDGTENLTINPNAGTNRADVTTTSGVVLRFDLSSIQFNGPINVLSPNYLYLGCGGQAEIQFYNNNTANIYQSSATKDIIFYCKSGTLYFSANNATNYPFKIYGTGVFMANLPSGATQAAAGAAATELWKTSGHATLPDNVVMVGV